MESGKKAIAILIFFVSVMLIGSISVQFRTVEETNSIGIETMQDEELRKEIKDWKDKYEEISSKLDDNNKKINEYANTEKDNQKASELLDKELNEYNMLIGKTNVVGSGVVVTLTDSYDRTYTSSNILYLINELKYAGAEAICVNDQRIINTTDIVTIQEKYILVNGERVTGPYQVKAIGNKSRLNDVLNFPEDGFIEDYKIQGYTIEMKMQDNIIIPAYNKKIEFKYLKEVE